MIPSMGKEGVGQCYACASDAIPSHTGQPASQSVLLLGFRTTICTYTGTYRHISSKGRLRWTDIVLGRSAMMQRADCGDGGDASKSESVKSRNSTHTSPIHSARTCPSSSVSSSAGASRHASRPRKQAMGYMSTTAVGGRRGKGVGPKISSIASKAPREKSAPKRRRREAQLELYVWARGLSERVGCVEGGWGGVGMTDVQRDGGLDQLLHPPAMQVPQPARTPHVGKSIVRSSVDAHYYRGPSDPWTDIRTYRRPPPCENEPLPCRGSRRRPSPYCSSATMKCSAITSASW